MVLYDIDSTLRKLSNGLIAHKGGETAIAQIIKDVLLTQRGESLFDPDNYTTLSDYLEESVNNINSASIRNLIFFALNDRLDELLISEDDITVTPNYDDQVYEIEINYREQDLQQTKAINFDIKIKR